MAMESEDNKSSRVQTEFFLVIRCQFMLRTYMQTEGGLIKYALGKMKYMQV